MEYKWSQYNLILAKSEHCVTILNTQSGAICDIENTIFDMYSDSSIDINSSMPYFASLIDMDYITHQNGQFSTDDDDEDVLRIVLSCTESCNLRCYYCFEKSHIKSCFFEQPKENAFINLLINAIKMKPYKKLHLIWFGGEPLLYTNKIVALTQRIISICKKFNVEYTSRIVTNATLTNYDTISLLHDAQIEGLQISFDGGLDKFVQYKNGNAEQWQRVISFFKNAINQFSITLRLNLDAENYTSIKNLLAEFHKLGLLDTCKIVIARINVNQDEKNYISLQEYYKKRIELVSYLCNELSLVNDSLFDDLVCRDCSCALIGMDAIVIDSNGGCHKCEDEIAINSEITIMDENQRLLQMIRSSENFPHIQCNTCSIYPICKGECPKHWDYNKCLDKIEFIKQLALLKVKSGIQ